MLGLQSLGPYPQARLASRQREGAVCAQHTPGRNHLLAALPAEDYERLLPNLEPMPLPLDWTVHRAGDPEEYLYFLTAGIVSRFYVTQTGKSTEIAVTGSEGAIGVALFLGGESTPSQAMVVSPGYSYRLEADLLKSEFEHDGPLPHVLLCYAQALIAQTGQVAVCNRHHSLEQQLCRWILSCLDRLPSNELTVTQERIADVLGVRRESVTEAAGKLQKAGLLECRRGHIVVLDRRQLETHVCECYAVVKREYQRLFPKYRQAARFLAPTR